MTAVPPIASEETPPDLRIAELERRITEMQAQHLGQVLNAELRSHASTAGMVDLDGIKLIDTTAIKLTEHGTIEGAEKLMTDLKRAKPWLFHAANSSSASATPPAKPATARRAPDMTHTEWQAARAEILRRR